MPGALRPAIDKVFTLDDVAEAHRYFEKGIHAGKIVVTLLGTDQMGPTWQLGPVS